MWQSGVFFQSEKLLDYNTPKKYKPQIELANKTMTLIASTHAIAWLVYLFVHLMKP